MDADTDSQPTTSRRGDRRASRATRVLIGPSVTSPSTARPWRADAHQAVTFVELFFDLVFVFAITQITAYTAHHLTLDGVARSILLFWLIWWAWTQFTWTLNPADADHRSIRLLTLVATAVALAMAIAVPGALDADGFWFAVPYVVVRVIGLGIQIRVEAESTASDHGGVVRWVGLSAVGMILVLVGGIASPELRPWIWSVAILADVIAAIIAGSRDSWDLDAGHMSERHGGIVIIALGESMIIIGIGISGSPRTPELVAAVGAALIVVCLLWWSYFGWLKDALEHAFADADRRLVGSLARDAYSLAHFPLVGGIIGFAAAVELIVGHPADPAPRAVVVALASGIVLFVGSSAVAYWRLEHRWLRARLVILMALVVVLAVAGSMNVLPAWLLVAVAAVLFVLVIVEERGVVDVSRPV